jgi:hypothetical protein
LAREKIRDSRKTHRSVLREEELIDSESVELDSLEAVEALLANWGIETGVFQAVWRSDYPL